MENQDHDWAKKPSEPLSLETFFSYQDGGGENHLQGYLTATDHLLHTIKKIEKAKSFTAMKKAVTAFRKDRENFYYGILQYWDKDTQKYKSPHPEPPV